MFTASNAQRLNACENRAAEHTFGLSVTKLGQKGRVLGGRGRQDSARRQKLHALREQETLPLYCSADDITLGLAWMSKCLELLTIRYATVCHSQTDRPGNQLPTSAQWRRA